MMGVLLVKVILMKTCGKETVVLYACKLLSPKNTFKYQLTKQMYISIKNDYTHTSVVRGFLSFDDCFCISKG